MKMNQNLMTMILTAGVACAAHAAASPKIKFDQTAYDFGTTALVQSVTGTFTFQNVGDAELQVQTPKPACGCTVAGVKPDRLKPGEKGELTFKLSLLNIVGPYHKSITVPSNDPQQPELKLDINGIVKPTFEITPKQAMFGEVHVNASASTTVTVKRVDGKKLAIKTMEITDPAVRVRTEPVDDTGQAHRLLLDVRADGEPRWFTATVQGITADSEGAVFSVPVTARFVGDVVVTPDQVSWNIIDEDEPAEKPQPHLRSITVSASRADQPLDLRNAHSDLKNLTVEIETVETGKTYKVMLTLTGLPKEPLTGTIRMETNLSSQPKIVVPVTIKVMRFPKQ